MQQVRSRTVQLTVLVPGVTVWNIWDLPLWAWRQYAAYVDEHRRQAKEAERNGS